MTDTALHPLLARLLDEHHYPRLSLDELDDFSARPGHSLILCAGDPVQHPEVLDVAVVLPELARAFPGRFRVAVASREAEPELQARYGLTVWPSLLLLRAGEYVGVLAGIQDWAVYLKRLPELLAADSRRPPSVGFPVGVAANGPAGHASACH